MATLAELKARIASELDRDDLTSLIPYAISDAIDLYKSRRFRFNQARATFSTVDGTEFYSTSTIPDDIGQIDAVTLTANGVRCVLDAWTYRGMQQVATNASIQGRPVAWAWYGEQMTFYPIPDGVYTVTLSYLQRIDIPASDADSNAWTTEALSLIRHSAKRMLMADTVRDDVAAGAFAQAEGLEYRRLVRDSVQLDVGPLCGSM